MLKNEKRTLLKKFNSSPEALTHYNNLVGKKVLFPQRFLRKKQHLVEVSYKILLTHYDNILFEKKFDVEEKFLHNRKRITLETLLKKLYPLVGYFNAVYWKGHHVVIDSFYKVETIGCKTDDDAKRLYKAISDNNAHFGFLFLGELKNKSVMERIKKKSLNNLYRKKGR